MNFIKRWCLRIELVRVEMQIESIHRQFDAALDCCPMCAYPELGRLIERAEEIEDTLAGRLL